jgi:Zn-finger nucleic acid-binding protein
MQMTCPKCHGDMRQYERSGVTIDQCTECRGVFLDRGELEKLFDAEANWSKQQGAQAQRPQQQAPQPSGYVPPPPPGGSYAQPGYAQPVAHGYPAAVPAYGAPHGGHHGHYQAQGHHGHYRGKKPKSFLNELFD